MPKYLIKARYSVSGITGVKAEGGTSRKDAISKAAKGLGGKLESVYFAFGDIDLYGILDLPDNVAAARFALAVGATGVATLETVPLLTPAEIDEAAKGEVKYRAPGA